MQELVNPEDEEQEKDLEQKKQKRLLSMLGGTSAKKMKPESVENTQSSEERSKEEHAYKGERLGGDGAGPLDHGTMMMKCSTAGCDIQCGPGEGSHDEGTMQFYCLGCWALQGVDKHGYQDEGVPMCLKCGQETWSGEKGSGKFEGHWYCNTCWNTWGPLFVQDNETDEKSKQSQGASPAPKGNEYEKHEAFPAFIKQSQKAPARPNGSEEVKYEVFPGFNKQSQDVTPPPKGKEDDKQEAFPGFIREYGLEQVKPTNIGSNFTRIIPKPENGGKLTDVYIDWWMKQTFSDQVVWKDWLYASNRAPNGMQYKYKDKMGTINVYLPGGTMHVTTRRGSGVSQDIYALVESWTLAKN
jgi:hypothetical protein